MAVLVRYQPASLTRETYDKVNQVLQSRGESDPPGALRIHVLFGDEGNLRVSEIWESEDDWRGFYEGTLGGAFSEVGVDMPAPEIVQVHALWGSGLQPS